MSPRNIIFNEKLVHWECQCSFWGEGLTTSSKLFNDVNPMLRNINAGFPDLQGLQQILNEYNNRRFTYAEDALPGVLGLLTVLSRTFVGGFLCGLPEMCFDMCLGWRSEGELKRRKYSDRPITSRLTPSTLPSWSWIGWQGRVIIASLETGRIPREGSNIIGEIIPVTEWFTGNSPDGSNLRRIRSNWFEHRSSFKDPSKPLPPGWTRHSVTSLEGLRNKRLFYPDGYDGFVFEHEGFPHGSEDRYWRFPFPVPDITTSTPSFMPEQTQYLFCRTKRAYVCAGRENPQSLYDLSVALWSDTNSMIGFLQLHDAEKRDTFWGSDPKPSSGDNPRHQVEILAIYKTRNESKNRSPALDQKEHRIGNFNTHTVLWVEWENGIAYRKACGWVFSAVWEELLQLEDVSLVLG